MARIKTSVKDESNSLLATVAAKAGGAGGDPKTWQLIPRGFYYGTVTKLEFGTYDGAAPKSMEKKPASGKITYAKLTPTVVLFNDLGTIIGRTDVTLGGWHAKKGLYQPDAASDKPALWPQGKFFLTALGLFEQGAQPGVFDLDFDPAFISDRVVRVAVGWAGYFSEKVGTFARNYQPAELLKLLYGEEVPAELTPDDLLNAVTDFNFAEDLITEDEEGNIKPVKEGALLRVKNVITGWYPIAAENVDRHNDENDTDWYYDEDSGAVFVNEAAYDLYMKLKDSEYQEPDL